MKKKIPVTVDEELDVLINDLKNRSFPDSTMNEMLTELIEKGLEYPDDSAGDTRYYSRLVSFLIPFCIR